MIRPYTLKLFVVVITVSLLWLAGSGDTHPVIAQTGAFTCETVTEIPKSECEALLAFYNSTNGPQWTDQQGWLQNNSPCSWSYVRCCSDPFVFPKCETDHVVILYPSHNQLSGTIPPELSNLTELVTLYLDNNQLKGQIPPELGNLSKLNNLDLSFNQLSGGIPATLGNLVHLEVLDLAQNHLSGSIPPELGNLAELEVLFLFFNQLSGPIPVELSNLSQLDFFTWRNNSALCLPTDLTFQNWLINLEASDMQDAATVTCSPTALTTLPQTGDDHHSQTIKILILLFLGSLWFSLGVSGWLRVERLR